MNKLELLGAIVANSVIGEERNEKLAELINEANKLLTLEDEQEQFALWRALGEPGFEVIK